jgi:hydroxymethylbilane synthase
MDRIREKHADLVVEIVDVPCEPGDNTALAEATGAGMCDLYVCGAREVPVDLPDDVAIVACTQRNDPFDVLIAQEGALLEDLAANSIVGVDSARVAVQIGGFRDDLKLERVVGTVDRLLDRLNAGELNAFIVAAEQVEVLGWEHAVSEVFPPDILLPAAGQGSFALVSRKSDTRASELAALVNHDVTRQVVRAERAFLRELGLRITDPVGVHGSFEGDTLVLEALLGDEISGAILRDDLDGSPDEEDALGMRLAKLFEADGAKDYLAGYK